MKNLLKKYCPVAAFVISLTTVAPSFAYTDELPWQGTELMFGAEQAGKTFALTEPTNATAVTFESYATLTGATLSLDAPARVKGYGALLTPLAGTNGLHVGEGAYSSVCLQETNQVIWRGISLAKVTHLEAYMIGIWCSNRPLKMRPVAFSNDGTSATALFQEIDDKYVKCFKVQFTQQGDDIVARIVWADYTTDFSSLGLDWDKASVPNRGRYTPPYATSLLGEHVGLTYMRGWHGDPTTLDGASLPSGPVTLDGEVVFTPSRAMTLTNAISGGVKHTTYRAPATRNDTCSKTGYLDTTEVLAFTNANIANVRFVSGRVDGTVTHKYTATLTNSHVACKFEAADRMILQIQNYDNSGTGNQWTKCVDVQFRQVGADVYMKALACHYAKYCWEDFYVAENDVTVRTDKTAAGVFSYGLRDYTFDLKGGYVKLSPKENTVESQSHVTFDGVITHLPTDNSLLARGGTVDVTNGARLIVTRSNWDVRMHHGSLTVNVEAGSVFHLGNQNWLLEPQAHPVKINLQGGTLSSIGRNYIGPLYLSNGAHVKSVEALRAGYYFPGNIVTTGSTPCFIDEGVAGAHYCDRTDHSKDINTFNLTADLHLVNQGLADCNFNGYTWVKTGTANLIVEAACTTENPIKVQEGKLVLAAKSTISNTNTLILAGGEIEAVTQSVNTVCLSLTDDSYLTLGTGATFRVAALGTWDTQKRLVIRAPLAKDSTITGLSVPETMTEAQIRALRFDDESGKPKRIHRLDSGCLTTAPSGFVLFAR